MVLSGLVTAWRLAGWPTSRSPSSVKATIEGVVRMPFGVLDDLRRLALHHGDAGVGGAEIDADDLGHGTSSLCLAGRPGPFGARREASA